MNSLEWSRIEADFRLWSFYEYYRGPYGNMKDSGMRFALALVASVAPIKDPHAVIQWHRLRKRNRTAEELERIAVESMERQSSRKERIPTP